MKYLHQANEKYGDMSPSEKERNVLFINHAMYEMNLKEHIVLVDGKFFAVPGRFDPTGSAAGNAQRSSAAGNTQRTGAAGNAQRGRQW